MLMPAMIKALAKKIMMLSYGVAARIDEILSLRLSDIHLNAKDPFVVLNGKGCKIRSIYLQKLLVEWLVRYLSVFTVYNLSQMIIYSILHAMV